MRGAVLGSMVVHGLLLAVLAIGERAPARPAEPESVIEVVVAPARLAVTAASAAGGGGSAASEVQTRASMTPRRAARSTRVHDEDPRGEIRIERAGDGTAPAGGGGDGGGTGGGRGRGIGFGDGGRIEVPAALPAVPPAPRPSRARPPILVYPAKRLDVAEEETFLARVTVDDEGFVVGARLVRGGGGPRADAAASLIFRFRYLPALDEDGRPVRATVDQSFLVGD